MLRLWFLSWWYKGNLNKIKVKKRKQKESHQKLKSEFGGVMGGWRRITQICLRVNFGEETMRN